MPQSEIFLIPAQLDECNPTDERLEECHWTRLFPEYENGFSQILRVLSQEPEQVERPGDAGVENIQHKQSVLSRLWPKRSEKDETLKNTESDPAALR